MKGKLILIGGGGHCKSCIDVIEQEGIYEIAGIVDVTEKLHQKLLGYDIIATEDDFKYLAQEYEFFFITLGQIKSPAKRIEIYKKLKNLGVVLPIIISPLAMVSRHAFVDEGTIVMHYALVNAGAKVGKNCIINTKGLIEHDVSIGNHCHISTAAVINGGVKIGSGTFFGSNAVCREYVNIGRNSLIGSQVKVLKDIPPNSFIK